MPREIILIQKDEFIATLNTDFHFDSEKEIKDNFGRILNEDTGWELIQGSIEFENIDVHTGYIHFSYNDLHGDLCEGSYHYLKIPRFNRNGL